MPTFKLVVGFRHFEGVGVLTPAVQNPAETL